MALPTSGLIGLEDIQAEFGGPASPTSLQNYYRGGALVPDTAANAGIPTSGVIGVQDFYGAAAFIVDLPASISRSGDIATGLGVQDDGDFSHGPTWGTPNTPGIGANYEIRLDKTSGSNPSTGDPLGTWINISTGGTTSGLVQWTWSGGAQGFEGTLLIRPVGGSTIDTAAVDITLTGP